MNNNLFTARTYTIIITSGGAGGGGGGGGGNVVLYTARASYANLVMVKLPW